METCERNLGTQYRREKKAPGAKEPESDTEANRFSFLDVDKANLRQIQMRMTPSQRFPRSIAVQYGVDMCDLARLNFPSDPNFIYLSKVLRIPERATFPDD
jgi:hypothetical protein